MPIHRKVKIHDIPFEPCWVASGTLNFYGQGWPYHTLLKMVGIDFGGITFVSKTTTLLPRVGNMPLQRNLMPKELFPKSIHINREDMCALNAVSLSGPGAKVILGAYELHNKETPFQLSFMSVEDSMEKRLSEFSVFTQILLREKVNFQAPIGLQINVSCPNTGHDNPAFQEILTMLDMCDDLVARGIAVILKISVEMPIENILAFGEHQNCHAITTSNTVPFKNLPKKINWDYLYPTGSPLLNRNLSTPLPGGLSGAPLFQLVLEQVKALRSAGFKKHINAGGGILYASDVRAMYEAGADSISIGSVAFLRPWAIGRIRRRAWKYFGEEPNLYL